MIGRVNGGGMTGIPSNIGFIKVFYQKSKLALNKGLTEIPLNYSVSVDRIVGVTINYGGYIGSQAMMDFNGNYNSDYGISFIIAKDKKALDIYASGSYPERDLNIIIFYI